MQPEHIEDRVAEYLMGEMPAEEAAEFERMMLKADRLRRDVERLRETLNDVQEWYSAPAPGLERVGQIEIPQVRAKRGFFRNAGGYR